MKYARQLAAFFAALVFLWGCSNPLDEPEQVSIAQNESALVRVNLQIDQARTALPEIGTLTAYKLEFFKNGETEPAVSQTINERSVTVKLFTGEYTLKVTGYDAENIARAEGMETVSVAGNTTGDVTVQLSATQKGTGTFAYTVTLPSNVTLTTGTLRLTSLSAGTNPTPIDLTKGLSGTVTVPSTYYQVSLVLVSTIEGISKTAAKTEIAHIYDNLNTSAAYVFADDEFTDEAFSEAGNATELEAALTTIRDSDRTNFTIYITSNFSLDSVSLTDTGYTGKTITIRSNGGTVREVSLSNSGGSLFTIGSSLVSPSLILQDITLKGKTNNSASLVKVNGGTLILKSSGTITGNTISTSGSGIYVASGGTLTMEGGAVSGNSSGGVYVGSDGTFTMKDGTISDNSSTGVYVASNGTFTMEGGTIGSHSSIGVYVDPAGTFTKTGGTISGNSGGGVYVSTGTFTTRGAIKEAANGNGDAKVNPRETHYLDIQINNSTNESINITSVVLSTTSEYVTIDKGTGTIGNLSAGYYQTLTYKGYSSSSTGFSSSYADGSRLFYSSSSYSSAFKFTVSSTCPIGTAIPFVITLTDSWGNTWTDMLTIQVVGTDAGLMLGGTTKFKITEAANGNGDTKVNPRETHYLDIMVQNTGSSNALGVTAALSTTTASSYITLDKITGTIGNLNAGYYQTLTYKGYYDYYDSSTTGFSSSYADGSLLFYSSSSYSSAFKFTVSSTCPTGEIPFTVTFTDSWGNTWTDTLTIQVVGTDAGLVLGGTTKFKITEAANGNGDTKVNPRETHYLDIQVQNTGSSNALGVTAALSTTTASSYVTLDKSTGTIGDLNAGYYQTLTYKGYSDYYDSSTTGFSSSYADGSRLLYSSSSYSSAFKFTVSSTCPIGTEIPFTVTFTDSWGNTWTDMLTIQVVGTDAGLMLGGTTKYKITEAANGNGDTKVNPRETHYLDIMVQNTGSSNALGVMATLSTTTASSYITLDKSTGTIGDMRSGYYQTLTYKGYSDYYDSSTTGFSSSYADGSRLLYSSSYYSSAFKFTVSSTCPIGTAIPFVITLTDSWGNTWTDTLTIQVVGTDAGLALGGTTKYKITEAANGNGDTKVNSRETHYLDIQVQNTGSSNALGVTAALSTTSPYITLDKSTGTIGNLNAGNYQTLTYKGYSSSSTGFSSSYADGSRLFYSSSSYSSAFKFTVSSTCPIGTEIPFTVTFTDSWGNTWTDTLTIQVVRTDASLSINTPVSSNIGIRNVSTSSDSTANPGETHYLDIRVKNSGASKALDVQALLTTSSTYVTIDIGHRTIGDLSAGYYKTLTRPASSSASGSSLLYSSDLSSAFRFTISETCPDGTAIPFTITFADSWGNEWTDTVTIYIPPTTGTELSNVSGIIYNASIYYYYFYVESGYTYEVNYNPDTVDISAAWYNNGATQNISTFTASNRIITADRSDYVLLTVQRHGEGPGLNYSIGYTKQ